LENREITGEKLTLVGDKNKQTKHYEARTTKNNCKWLTQTTNAELLNDYR
jgi:hypothetical protein